MLLPTELDVEFCNATIEEISEYSEIYDILEEKISLKYTGMYEGKISAVPLSRCPYVSLANILV